MKEIFSPRIEIEERSESKLDLNLFRKKSSARTPSGLVLGYLKKLRNSDIPLEYKIMLQGLYKEIWNLEESEKVVFESWKGKSDVKYFLRPDRIIAVRFRKFDKNEKPREVSMELLKSDINRIIWGINKLNKGQEIPTSEIAEEVYNKKWKYVFSNRKQHVFLVECLNYLEYVGLIHYFRSGKIKVLRNVRYIQEIIK